MPYLLALSLLVAPLYVWRFAGFGPSTNFLMLWVILVWGVFVAQLWRGQAIKLFIRHMRNLNRGLLILISLFALAGLISLFVGGHNHAKLGQFIVLFLQPISLFFIADYTAAQNPRTRLIIRNAAYLFVALSGALALIQYFGLATLPEAYWGNSVEPKRAVGFFGHPDMFGLFLAPLLAWLLPDVLQRLGEWRQKKTLLLLAAWVLGGAGLLLCLSRGAWLGFGVAAIAGIIVFGRKKYWLAALVAMACAAVIIVSVPNLRYRLILPFKGEKSSVARLSLWHTGTKMIKASPLLGQGLTGFGSNWYKYNTDPHLGHYNFPHNIFLNFWVDTGLLGLLSFAGLLLCGWWYGFKYRRNTYALGLALFLLALTAHGLIDTPYLKNDLALVFWLIWGISRPE
jgi:O-antigen ligase